MLQGQRSLRETHITWDDDRSFEEIAEELIQRNGWVLNVHIAISRLHAAWRREPTRFRIRL
jgi:hypothetical protein